MLAPGLAAQGLVISPESEPPASVDEEIPTLFSSVRLENPTPAAAEVKPAAKPAPVPEPVAAVPKPEPQPEPVAAETGQALEDIAEWEKDPTLAELRPDIEALEQALADFQDAEDEPKEEAVAEPIPEVKLKDPTLPGVPVLTLDFAIEKKVSEAQEELARTDALIAAKEAPEKPKANDGPEPKVGVPPLVSPPPAIPEVEEQKADAELEKIAAGLASAKSIDDVDDEMAETLFGEEFSLMAAKVAAMSPTSETANQDLEAAAGTPADAEDTESAGESSMEKEFKEVYGEDGLEVSIESESGGGLDLSASQRLATVRALNADKAPVVGVPRVVPVQSPGSNGAGTASPPVTPPESIEDQINTSMTQTLKALNVRPKSSIEDDDDEDTKRGFFSRFKRS